MSRSEFVLSQLGVVLELTGMFMLVPVIVGGLFGEGYYLPFIIGAIASFAIGTILDRKFPRGELDFSSAMLLASISFILVSLVGAVPYLPLLTPVDAVFESVSGFTTTGMTTVLPEQLPKSLIFWRSLTQWLGGIGILLIFMMMLPSLGMSSYFLYIVEGKERIKAGVYHSMRRISIIYASYTVIGVLLFALAGMSLFDAFSHSLTSVSTGGFSTMNGSLASFNNPFINTVACLLMILGATSFLVHDKLWNFRFMSYIKNPETRLFWAAILIFSVLLIISGLGIFPSMFHVISAVTTTGFTVSEIETATPSFIISLIMLIGGFAGSTAGGLKLIRVFSIGKGLYWLGKKMLLPREAVVPFRLGGSFLRAPELLKIFLFVIAYMLLISITTIALSVMGYNPVDAFFQASSAQGTVGLSVIPVSTMPEAGKVLLMINMLLGRLEIFPFLALVLALFRIRR